MRAWLLATGLLAALVLGLLFLLFTPPGLSLVGRMVEPLSGGAVRVEGLGGTSPNHLRAARVELADRDGVWLRAEQAVLDWSALSLLRGRVTVANLQAAAVTVLRRPVAREDTGGSGPDIAVARLALPRILLAPPLAGRAVTLSAEGSLRYVSLDDLAADLRIARADNTDIYSFAGRIGDGAAEGSVTLREGADGILGRLAGLPQLGPVNLALRADGPRAANRLSLDLSAGLLRAQGTGLLRLPQDSAEMALRVSSPAMSPREGAGWERLEGEIQIRGTLRAPQIAGRLQLDGGRLDGLSARAVTLMLDGNSGRAQLRGEVQGLRLPGDHPAIFAAAPWAIEAEADLQAAARPVQFRLNHPLARLAGEARTRGGMSLQADLAVPSLAPFAALENVRMNGSAALHLTLRQAGGGLTLAADGQVSAAGEALTARMLGGGAMLALTAQMQGSDIVSSRVRLAGAGFNADITGSLRGGTLDYRLTLNLRDLTMLAEHLRGALSIGGTVRGAIGAASLAADGAASVAMEGFAPRRVAIRVRAEGLPALRQGRLDVTGNFADAPVALHATLTDEKTRRLRMDAEWKSLSGEADLTLRAGVSGPARLSVTRLSDLAALAGGDLEGGLEASLLFGAETPEGEAELRLTGTDLRQGDIAVARLSGEGRITQLWRAPDFDLTLTAEGFAVPGFTGSTQARLEGPASALAVTAQTRLTDGTGGLVQTSTQSLLDMPMGELRIASLTGEWRGVKLALQSPATLRYGDEVAIEGLDLRIGAGSLAGEGRLSPQLAFRAEARALALETLRPLFPQYNLRGTLSGEAELSGTLQQPRGRISLRGEGLQSSLAAGTAPGTLRAELRLEGDHAAVDASLVGGERMRLTVSGDAALTGNGALRLTVEGRADLALLDPILAVEGRRARGVLAFNGAVTGTRAAPRLAGAGTLADGELQDYARGLRVSDIAADLRAEGPSLHIERLTARAGPGSFSGSGRLDLFAAGLPIDMTLIADRARPIVSDLVTATVSGNLRLSGRLRGQTVLAGALRVVEGEINLPERFPPEVAILDVRRGDAPPPPPPPPQALVLDLTIRSEGPLFVRGRGIEAEMRGDITLGGNIARPDVGGAFRLVRGSYSLGGQRLDFSSGTVRFDGTGLRRRLDPSLDFIAQTVSNGVTARLAVTGYSSQPRLALSSTPVLPQDEIVAHLLFGQSVKQLSALQLASLAQAAGSLGGIGGGFNPLGAVRRTLGLDRLSVGSASTANSGQSQTTVEAGRYVTRNVYVGVQQNLSGGTRTQVQVDITDRLKALATTSMGGTTQGAARQDNGSSIGLSYELEY